jgi:hypothetical protein
MSIEKLKALQAATSDKFLKASVAVSLIGVVSVAPTASAASVIDTGMKTALVEGFTTLKDTVADVITTSWPFMLGIMCLVAAPTIAKRFFKQAAS